jgi:hypothetical protein
MRIQLLIRLRFNTTDNLLINLKDFKYTIEAYI